jgi:GT2 family glycosyltransferase
MDPRISLVIATRNRRVSLDRTLRHLLALPESPRIVVVDNASSDATAEFVREAHPPVRLIVLPRNMGAAARTVGVRATESDYVAFSDDDSWWAAGSLSKIADKFDAHSRLALVAARVLVGPDETVDPLCLAMASSPLPTRNGVPGPTVLGFLACGAAVRRQAFLDAGGFEGRYGVGGEEELLAIDLTAAGWSLVYCADAIAYHHPDVSAPRPGRRRRQIRNGLWSVWLRRSLPTVIGRTARAVSAGNRDPEARLGILDALSGLPWIVRNRRVISRDLECALRRLGL